MQIKCSQIACPFTLVLPLLFFHPFPSKSYVFSNQVAYFISPVPFSLTFSFHQLVLILLLFLIVLLVSHCGTGPWERPH